jgi:hypothetical protein
MQTWSYSSGTTGGWCGAASSINWSASYVEWMNKEKLYYGRCALIVPPGIRRRSPASASP